MDKPRITGIPRLKAAWINSFNGLKDIWKQEEAFRQEVLVLVLSIPFAILLGETAFQTAILIGAVALIIIVEILNTAIEAVVDRIGPERHELSRIAKDLGSLAVLLASLLSGMVWCAVVIDWIVGWKSF